MSKEVKTFFNKTNRLNKGYQHISEVTEYENINLKKQLEKLLPPIEVASEYESLYPGTISKILEIVEKEQNHRHQQDKAKTSTTNSKINLLNKATYFLTMGMLLVALLLTNLFVSNIYINLTLNTIIFIVLVLFIVYNKQESVAVTTEVQKNSNVSQYSFKQGVQRQQGSQNKQRSQNVQPGKQGRQEHLYKVQREQVEKGITQESTNNTQKPHNLRGSKQKNNRFR